MSSNRLSSCPHAGILGDSSMSDSDWGAIVFAIMIAVVAFVGRGRTRNLSAISKRDWILYIALSLLFIIGVFLYSEFSR